MTLDNLNKVLVALQASSHHTTVDYTWKDLAWDTQRAEAIKIIQDEIDECDTPKDFTRNPKLEAAVNTFKEEAEIDPDAALEKYKATADSLGFGVMEIDSALTPVEGMAAYNETQNQTFSAMVHAIAETSQKSKIILSKEQIAQILEAGFAMDAPHKILNPGDAMRLKVGEVYAPGKSVEFFQQVINEIAEICKKHGVYLIGGMDANYAEDYGNIHIGYADKTPMRDTYPAGAITGVVLEDKDIHTNSADYYCKGINMLVPMGVKTPLSKCWAYDRNKDELCWGDVIGQGDTKATNERGVFTYKYRCRGHSEDGKPYKPESKL